MSTQRVLSGMRPTGSLHLGHYHGVLKNWLNLQHQYPCFFFVADWHALTTEYDNPHGIINSSHEMVVDWLASGVDPLKSTIFVQSQVMAHAELHLLLSMSTPLSWLERVPTYKDQQEKLSAKDLTTYGFLGYPLLQAADILIYRAAFVPVGEDQVPHIEFSREIARRFNHLYGKETDFVAKAQEAAKKLGNQNKKRLEALRLAFQQEGKAEAIIEGKALIAASQSISNAERERLFGFLEGTGKQVLVEPAALLTPASKMPGLDGQKMSKSYNNTISLRENGESVAQKIKKMPTDTNRVRRTDVGDPARCPVWQLHLVYSDEACQNWVQQGCKSAGIGCIECKTPIIEAILKEQIPMFERAEIYLKNPKLVTEIIEDGNKKANLVATETMREVREAMGLNYANKVMP